MTRPASRFVHRRARREHGEHDYSLDIASDAAPNYLHWVADMCAPYLGPEVLDLGAGHGTVTQYLAGGRRVVALDASDDCVAAMAGRFRDTPNVSVVQGDLRSLDSTERFDSIVMINVLEHILDDSGVLSSLRGHLKADGTIVLYVPALNGLYTEWDHKVGHFRRYSKRRLAGVVREAGLTVVQLRYANLLALPAWVVSGLLLKSDQTIGRSLSLWDRTGTRLSRAIEARVRIPIGLNLLCVAKDCSGPKHPSERLMSFQSAGQAIVGH